MSRTDRKLIGAEGLNARLGVYFETESLADLDGTTVYGPVSPDGELDMSRAWYRVELTYDRRGQRAKPKPGKLWATAYAPLMTASLLDAEEQREVSGNRTAFAKLMRTTNWQFVPVWSVTFHPDEPDRVIKATLKGLNVAASNQALLAAEGAETFAEKLGLPPLAAGVEADPK